MIRIEGLCKKFGAVEAVKNLDLEIPRGELFCFLGPNGAGKTTTIKMLCGLLRPSAGRILVGGHDLALDPRAARRITGYVPDQPFLYERLTPEEFFEFTGELYGIPRDVVLERREQAFAQFGLEDYRLNLVKDLSHGLRQRLTYAVTFLHEPEVLFVDEPFVGLDPYSIRLIKDLLRQKAAQGAAILLTTHILALAEGMADRIGIIHKGQLIAMGTLKELADQQGGVERLEDLFLELTSQGAAE
jgi:ABC-2 type transport system ATP-binding protein